MSARHMIQINERLLEENHDLQDRLAIKERQCLELTEELGKLKSREFNEREDRYPGIVLINRILRVFAVASDDDILFEQVLGIALEGLESRHGVFGYIAEPGHLICPSLSTMLAECEVEGKCIHYPPGKWKGLWTRALLEKRIFFTNKPSPVPEGHSTTILLPPLFSRAK